MHRALLGTQRLQENLQSGAAQNGKTHQSHQLHFERLDYTVLRSLDYHINHIHPVITSAVMGASHDLRVREVHVKGVWWIGQSQDCQTRSNK